MNIVNITSVCAFTTKDTSTIREIMAPRNSEITRQSLAEATLRPGACTEAHYHPQTEELYYIVQGTALIAIEGETHTAAVGDAIGILPGQRHQIRNLGDEDLVFLCCCVPAYADTDTIMCTPLL